MSIGDTKTAAGGPVRDFLTPGMFWLVAAVAGAVLFFSDGLAELFRAWQLPEYSHGPLIPVLSALLFLRHLKSVPIETGPVTDRWPGVGLVILSLVMAALGIVANIPDLVAYAIIIWVGGLLLISFGWAQGRQFWPPVLHLVYMLPLPAFLYYEISTSLQMISSELGVMFLRLLSVPVFLDGNIIDLGVQKLHVAEACSGLRYLFPILSFSYIFAVLYRGPMWHKAVLLISAAPITVLMNSVRIAMAGFIVNHYGLDWAEGFSHFFEGWVIFISCIVILFGLARLMLFLHPARMSLTEALDLDTAGLAQQARRIALIEPSRALIVSALLILGAGVLWYAQPERTAVVPDREPFTLFPREIAEWRQQGLPGTLEASVVRVLAADDYHSVNFAAPGAAAPVDLFMTWYADQNDGGTHSPRDCLPGGGWEIAAIEEIDLGPRLGRDEALPVNRAVIQKGTVRMAVYYWIEQQGRMLTGDFAAGLTTIWDRTFTGRTDTGLVRLITPILEGETDAAAFTRLDAFADPLLKVVPRFLPAR